MKIRFDHQIFCKQRHGGVSRYFIELASCLKKSKTDDVSIFCPFHKNEYLYKSGFKKSYYIQDFPGSSIALRGINTCIGMATTKMNKSIDVFHETYYSGLSIKPPSSAGIITVFDMIHEKFPEHFQKYDVTSKEKRISVSRADHVICISESTRKDLIEIFGIKPEKTSVVYLGHSFSCSNILSERPMHKPYLLYVGQRRGYKNFNRFIQAYSESSVRLEGYSIICFGGGAFTEEEKIMFRKLKILESEIFNVGGSDEILSAYYSHAAMLVYPSLYEGFGIPLLEAMSHGCPVACSETSSLPEVGGNAALYFNPFSVDDIRYKIDALAFDKPHSQNLINAGWLRATEFSWDNCADNTKRIYEKCL
jgi:glycosyltransferase involved in cell wall biosynthesis